MARNRFEVDWHRMIWQARGGRLYGASGGLNDLKLLNDNCILRWSALQIHAGERSEGNGRRRCRRLPQDDFITAAHLAAHGNSALMQLHEEEVHAKG